ncbi:MAG: hypothetical protein ABID87_02425 [Chloroflexota bacterium]
MFNWQITATTVHCEDVDDEVTVMVYKDGSIKCVGYEKYGASKEAIKALREKSRQSGRDLKCSGTDCPRAVQYREKLLAEEKTADRKTNRKVK